MNRKPTLAFLILKILGFYMCRCAESGGGEVFILSGTDSTLALENSGSFPSMNVSDPTKTSQLWKIDEKGTIESVSKPGSVLDIEGGVGGTNVIIWSRHNGANQQFDLSGMKEAKGAKIGQIGLTTRKDKLLVISNLDIGGRLESRAFSSGPPQGSPHLVIVPKSEVAKFIANYAEEQATNRAALDLRIVQATLNVEKPQAAAAA